MRRNDRYSDFTKQNMDNDLDRGTRYTFPIEAHHFSVSRLRQSASLEPTLLVSTPFLIISNPLTIFSMFFRSLAGLDAGPVAAADATGGDVAGTRIDTDDGDALGLTVSKADDAPPPPRSSGEGAGAAVDAAAAAATAAAAAAADEDGDAVTGEGDAAAPAPSVYGAKRCGLKRSLTPARDDVVEWTDGVDGLVALLTPEAAAATAESVAALQKAKNTILLTIFLGTGSSTMGNYLSFFSKS